MADLNADIEKRVEEYKEAQDITVVPEKQGPRIVEGNTGTLTVLILDQINEKLSRVLEFVEEIKKEKV